VGLDGFFENTIGEQPGASGFLFFNGPAPPDLDAFRRLVPAGKWVRLFNFLTASTPMCKQNSFNCITEFSLGVCIHNNENGRLGVGIGVADPKGSVALFS
jgi:hypothetical protein